MCQSPFTSGFGRPTTNNDSDLRELDEVNVRLAARLVACLDVPRNVRARDMVYGCMVYVQRSNDRILVGSLACPILISIPIFNSN